ncbi:MAG: prepilin peptidase [Sphingopyxis sp.]
MGMMAPVVAGLAAPAPWAAAGEYGALATGVDGLLRAAWPLAIAMPMGALAGAIAGSFLATIIIRWPQGRSIAHGRSACDGCGVTLRAVNLVPIISWALARGRCRRCGHAIHPIHPVMEGACAAMGALCAWLAPNAGGAALAIMVWQLLTLAVLDARHWWLPHRLSALLGLTGLAMGGAAMGALGLSISLIDRAVGAAAGGAALWAVGAAFARLRHKDGLGGGDPPMFAAIGAWVGWAALPALLLLAAVAGLMLAVAARLTARVIARLAARRDGAAPTARANAQEQGQDPAHPPHFLDQRMPLGTLMAMATPFAVALMVIR